MILTTDNRPVMIAGDIHGNIKVMEKIVELAAEEYAHCIFVGDYLDSFPHSRADQKKCLQLVKDLHDHDDYTFLKGNHELAYINYDLYPCSGYSSNFSGDVSPRVRSIDFEDYVIIDDKILVTHAGLSNLYIEAYNGYWENSMGTDSERLAFVDGYLSQSLQDPEARIYRAGRLAGGSQPVGGIFWCRPQNFKPFGKEIIQVFGHTHAGSISYYPSKRAFNVDCLEFEDSTHQVLMYMPGGLDHFKIKSV